MKKIFWAILTIMIVAAVPAFAGEYHVASTLVCYDCHTPHFSMQHSYNSSAPVAVGVGAANGNWLGATGPNQHLLKAPDASAVCLSCHNGQTFAPDVMEVDTNALESSGEGRSAGALNETTSLAPFDTWKGHTIGIAALPPGYNAGIPGTIAGMTAASVLECTSCHVTHGSAPAYRNLGTRGVAATQPTFTVSTSHTGPCVNAINNQTGVISTVASTGNGCDVWININQASYTAGTSNFVSAGYYDTKNVYYNRNDVIGSGATSYSNKMDQFCGQCHSAFHGGPDGQATNLTDVPSSILWSAGIGVGSAASDFIRHPTGTVSLGGGITSLGQYNGGQTRVKAYDTVPQGSDTGVGSAVLPAVGCVSCHKAHGNQNPFGLIFMARAKSPLTPGPINEQGSWSTADTPNLATGYRNLCGQCHSIGN